MYLKNLGARKFIYGPDMKKDILLPGRSVEIKKENAEQLKSLQKQFPREVMVTEGDGKGKDFPSFDEKKQPEVKK